ncbi:hypothetical protein A2U01_0091433, partial [Trifolium medium]|nr:hypothetical protein [Trifolium medium]
DDNPSPRGPPHKGGDMKKNDRPREPQGPPSQFTSYTPLVTFREHILSECATSEFRKGGIKFQSLIKTGASTVGTTKLTVT